MVNFKQASISMTSVETDFPTVHFPYLSSYIPESPLYGVMLFMLISHYRFVRNMKIFCSIYSGFKVIEAGIFFTETSDYSS